MPDTMNHVIKLFADDSKLITIIQNVNDLTLLQQNLDALTKWSATWKRKIMEFNRSGQNKHLSIGLCMGETRSVLNKTSAGNDLGVTFASNFKFSSHIKCQASILGQPRRTFRFWTNTTVKTLYCGYLRPHLEYAVFKKNYLLFNNLKSYYICNELSLSVLNNVS